MRVLIADDSTLFVERVTSLLAQMPGVEVVGQAGNAAEAACALRRLNPDVMILDIEMPGGSGIGVLEGIARDRLTTTVIVLTNHGTPQYRRRCLQSGAQFFLDKSADFDKLAEVLQTLARDVSA
jgi:DNA-binding NarL/FixJ family response regulator